MQIPWWELQELLDHLRDREDIWSSPRENLWVRTAGWSETDQEDSEQQVCGLAISNPTSLGPLRQHQLRFVPLAWSAVETDEYFLNLLRHWTEYGIRERYTSFLVEEAKMEPKFAATVAIGLCYLDTLPAAPLIIPSSQRKLWPDTPAPDITRVGEEIDVRVLPITGGGWVRLSTRHDMLHCEMSVRSLGSHGGGFSDTFQGYVRPRRSNFKLALAALFGNDVEYKTDDPDKQRDLPTPSGGEGDSIQPEPGTTV